MKEGGDMRNNVFLKSAIRSPIQNLMLMLLVGIAVFAATLRAAEYIIVRAEIARVESFYRSIGFLSTIDPIRQNFIDFDDRTWQDVISQSPYVESMDLRSLVTGELEGIFNSENIRILYSSPYFAGETWYGPITGRTWHNFESDYALVDSYFIGTLIEVRFVTDREPTVKRPGFATAGLHVGGEYAVFIFNVNEIVIAYPDHMMLDYPVRLIVPLDNEGSHPAFEMEIGGQYLLRATYSFDIRVMAYDFPTYWGCLWLEGFPEDTRNRRDVRHPFPFVLVIRPLLPENDMYFLSADDPDIVFVMTALETRFENLYRNMRSVILQTTSDMYSMHANRTHVGTVGFPLGRWITHEDYLNANPVVVVTDRFLRARGLSHGDIITITLRENIPSALPYAYDAWRDYRTHTLDLEIIGTFGHWSVGINFVGAAWANHHPGSARYFSDNPISNRHGRVSPHFMSHFMYIPASLIPYGFELYQDRLCWDNQFTFFLDSTRNEQAFLNQNREALAALGYNVHFVPQAGAVNFFFAVDNILLALGFNLIIFSVTSALMLALAAFIYVIFMRRNFAIARSLGSSPARASWHMLVPVVLLWTPVVILATISAWLLALGMAEGVLSTVYDLEPHLAHMARDEAMSIAWPLGLTAIMITAVIIAMLVGIIALARRPVLESLQRAGR